MNIGLVGNSQYVQTTASVQNTSSKTEGTSSKVSSNIDNHKLEGLDERGNAILNQLLVGKTEKEKTDMKMVMDGMMLFEAKLNPDGTVTTIMNKDTSKESIVAKLDKLVHLDELDPSGNQLIDQITRQLRDMYKSGYSPLDMKA